MENQGRNDHVEYYGPWGWIGGLALGCNYYVYNVFSS